MTDITGMNNNKIKNLANQCLTPIEFKNKTNLEGATQFLFLLQNIVLAYEINVFSAIKLIYELCKNIVQ